MTNQSDVTNKVDIINMDKTQILATLNYVGYGPSFNTNINRYNSRNKLKSINKSCWLTIADINRVGGGKSPRRSTILTTIVSGLPSHLWIDNELNSNTARYYTGLVQNNF